jgi:uncharacterized MAPEG superfamily protein
MSTELTMLAWSVGLLFLLVVIQGGAGILANGPAAMAGARDDLPPPKPFHARALRVVDNHRENLIIFAPLVLIAGLAHISTFTTMLGAELFFYGRLVHAVTYLAGIPWVRTIAWAVSTVGIVMLFYAVACPVAR